MTLKHLRRVSGLTAICAAMCLSAVCAQSVYLSDSGANIHTQDDEWFQNGVAVQMDSGMNTCTPSWTGNGTPVDTGNGISVDTLAETAEFSTGEASLSAGAQQSLSPPTNLGWGRDYRFTVSTDTQNSGTDEPSEPSGTQETYASFPGMMYWEAGQTTQNVYTVSIYRQEPEDDVLIETVDHWRSVETDGHVTCFRFLMENRTGGDYYFTVKATGDGVNYSDSTTVTSPVWHYEVPEAQIQTPDRPKWDGRHISTVSTSEDDPYAYAVAGYHIRWYFEAEETDEEEESENTGTSGNSSGSEDSGDSGGSENGGDTGGTGDSTDSGGNASATVSEDTSSGDNTGENSDSTDTSGEDSDSEDNTGSGTEEPSGPVLIGDIINFHTAGTSIQLPDRFSAANGQGYYSLQVRILSSDIATVASSEWSEISRARLVTGDIAAITDIVHSVRETSLRSDQQAAFKLIRAMDFEELRTAMVADVNNTAAAGDIAYLEQITGNQAKIDVADDISELFAPDKISVIGAGLNVDVGESVTLELGKPESEIVLPSIYVNAVQFSMELADKHGNELTADGEDLFVPVKITLPIPESINPQYFVMIHHHADGSSEEMERPSLRQIRGTWYATFVVRSFSVFTMAERLEYWSAERNTEGISLTYLFRPHGENNFSTLLCAAYDRQGRILYMSALEAFETRRTVMLKCDGANVKTVRVFMLDGSFTPTAAVRETVFP